MRIYCESRYLSQLRARLRIRCTAMSLEIGRYPKVLLHVCGRKIEFVIRREGAAVIPESREAHIQVLAQV